jgi:hypothetical protein
VVGFEASKLERSGHTPVMASWRGATLLLLLLIKYCTSTMLLRGGGRRAASLQSPSRVVVESSRPASALSHRISGLLFRIYYVVPWYQVLHVRAVVL